MIGASPKAEENPSLRGPAGGRRPSHPSHFEALLKEQISGASPKPAGNPSLRGAEGGRQSILEKQVNEYAGFFVDQMMQAMRQTTLQRGLLSGSRGEEVFQGWMDRHFSEDLAKSLKFCKAFGKTLEHLGRQDRAALEAASRTA